MDGNLMEREIAGPAIDKIALALAKAQAKITNPERNREVTVKTKTGSSYKFKYATLDAIIDHIRPHLTENGLWFTQTLANGDGRYKLITTLVHESGQSISSETPLLVQGQGNQEFGSALTYMRRYALTALLGIAADEDDDANAADGNTVERSAERGTKARTAAPQSNGEAWKDDATRLKGEIDRVRTVKAVDNIIANNGDVLANIKQHSDSAYDFLMKRANERKDAIREQSEQSVLEAG